MKGSTYRRCGCTDDGGRPLGAECPRLASRNHGSWYYYAELSADSGGKRRRQRQGGFATQREAQAALVDLQDRVQKRTHVDVGRQTLGDYLDAWLAGKAKLTPSTRRTYAEHIRLYLKPALGHIRLDQLTPGDIERMYAAIRCLGTDEAAPTTPELTAMLAARQRGPRPRPLTAARLRRVHTTLKSALGTAVKRGSSPTTRPTTSSWPPAGHPRRSSGPSSGSPAGGPPANGSRSRSGGPPRPGSSSTTPSTTGSTPCCTSSPSAGCAAARPSGCAGPRSTSTTPR